jgi:predicted nucleic acid-binding protein
VVKALFDTNILIDHLNSVSQAREELARYRHKAISIVTWVEVLVGANAEKEARTRSFLDQFEIVAFDHAVAERAVELRRSHAIKLPDAVIWASAQVHAMLLVTRNIQDFPADDPGVRMPYVV